MELRIEYKKTDLGLVPNDWKVEALPNHIWFQEGPGLRNWQFKDSGLKVINVTNLEENGFLNLSTTRRHISWNEFEKMYRHFLIDENDILIASSGNSYCKVAIVRAEDLPILMNTSVIRFKPLGSIEHGYMLAYLKSSYFKNQIDLLITGGAQPNFGPVHLRKIFIPLPPSKAEQTAIATALSDMDALISSLEKLIEKKKAIKQGVMQELLKPKEGWVVKRLGDSVRFQVGYPLSSVYFNQEGQGFRIVKNHDLKADDQVYYFSSNFPNEYILEDGDLLVGMDGDFILCEWNKGPAVLNQRVGRILSKDDISKKFLYYYLASFLKEIERKTSSTTVKHLSHTDVEDIELPLPAFDLQQKIACILGDLDSEIQGLNMRLTKSILIKQAMMQELLTGKTRLI